MMVDYRSDDTVIDDDDDECLIDGCCYYCCYLRSYSIQVHVDGCGCAFSGDRDVRIVWNIRHMKMVSIPCEFSCVESILRCG
jgi:hypothetical protein